MVVERDEETSGEPEVLPVALWVIPVSQLGGVARHVIDAAKVGIPGFELVVLCPEGQLVRELRALGVRVVVAKFGPDFGMTRSVRALRTAVRRVRPSVVHSHLAYADVIVATTPMDAEVIRVTTEHGIAGDDRVYHGSSLKSAVMARVHSVRLSRFDGVIAVAEATKQAMLVKWAPKQEIRVVYNGVDAPEQNEIRTDTSGASLRILALARLSPEKRIPQLLRAFAKVVAERPEAHLMIAGEGELESELKTLSGALGLADKVSFPGFVDAEEAMAQADVLAQLSVWENCSYSLLDAAKRGLRVVASSVGGNPEILGYRSLVDADDVDAVATALLDVEAPAELQEWPSVQVMTEAIAEVYRGAGARMTSSVLPTQIYIAANNGDLGGGEVMLLRLAEALRDLSVEVTVVAPKEPSGVADAARDLSFQVIALEATSRKEWTLALRRWDREHRRGLLWANGLVPAVASLGHKDRVVHLHQVPRSAAQHALALVAKLGAKAVIVPSEWMRNQVAGSTVLSNWSPPVEASPRTLQGEDVTVLGFLGRPSISKGVDTLAIALELLEKRVPGKFRLQIGGVPHFVSEWERAAVKQALEPVRHRVEELGWIDPADFFGRIHLLIVPSAWPETFGLVVAEAMSAGVPVITSGAGALPEILNQPNNIFETGNAEDLADVIMRAASADRTELTALGRQRWLTRYSPAAAQRQLEDLLRRL